MYEILAHEYNNPVQYVCSMKEGHYFLSDRDKNNASFKTKEGADFVVNILRDELPFKRYEVIRQ